jgi:hypothetical protein
VKIRVIGLLFVFLTVIPGKSYAASPVIISNLNGITNLAGSYALNADIDGTSHNTLGDFSGQLDGQGFRISNLTSPVFNELLNGAVIRNLNLEGVDVTGLFTADVGALANRATGAINIDNIGISGEVTGTGITGGLIGAYRYSSTTGIPDDTTFITLNRINLTDLEVSGSNSSGGLFGVVDISVNKQSGITCSNCNQTNNTDSINDSNITGMVITDSEFRNLVINASSQGSAGGIIGEFMVRNDTETLAQSNFSYLGGDIQTTASVTNNGKSINNGTTLGLDLSNSIFDNITVENLGSITDSNFSGGLIGDLFVSSSAKSNSKVFASTFSGDASYLSGQVINSSLAYAINTGDITAINLSDVNLKDFTVTSSSTFAGLVIGDLSIEKTVESEALVMLVGSTATSSGTVINEANSTNSGNLQAINSMNLISIGNQVVSSNNPINQNIGNVNVNQGTTTRASTDLYRNSVLFTFAGSNSGISSNQTINQGSSYLTRSSNSTPSVVPNFMTAPTQFLDGLSESVGFAVGKSDLNKLDIAFLEQLKGDKSAQIIGSKLFANQSLSTSLAVGNLFQLEINFESNKSLQMWVKSSDNLYVLLGNITFDKDGKAILPGIEFKKSGQYEFIFVNSDKTDLTQPELMNKVIGLTVYVN